MNNSLYGNFRTRKFTDIWPQFETFKADYDKNGVGQPLNDQSIQTLYYLLYARYGNSHILSSDENQFKYKVWSKIFMYGPTWTKRLELQERLRNMSEDELTIGGRSLVNHSSNPSQPIFATDTQNQVVAQGTDSDTELATINNQNVAKFRKGKLDAYAILSQLLETDVTDYFLSTFSELFIKFCQPYEPLWYTEDMEDSTNE